MKTATREFGIVGLGRMGGGLALQALEKNIRVVGFDTHGASTELTGAGMVEVPGLDGFRGQLAPPRAVFLYVPAGPVVDSVLNDLAASLEAGDLIVDAGNSYWGDSIRRHGRLAQLGIHLVDLGTSGGIEGARNGACFMAGGDPEAVARIEPILVALAVEGGYVNAGPSGAGHFTKLVHNGIEFGMLQAIGEGVDLLERYHDQLAVYTENIIRRLNPCTYGFWKEESLYPKPNDWVFAGLRSKGEYPFWPDILIAKVIRPAAVRPGIEKRIGWHTFRHTFSTMLIGNDERQGRSGVNAAVPATVAHSTSILKRRPLQSGKPSNASSR